MSRKKTGIYIHIPFCVKKCNYCDFLSGPFDEKTRKNYVDALLSEIEHKAKVIKGEKKDPVWEKNDTDTYYVSTVYIGGGTPSVLEAADMERILRSLGECFDIRQDESGRWIQYEGESEIAKPVEVTIEVNPGTVSLDKFVAYKKMGINRISMGVQSANDEELKLLGRIHTFEEARQAFREARKAGFDNISVDIISALPEQSIEAYRDNLEKILALEPEHISSYSLIIEEGTKFFELFGEGGVRTGELPSEELDRAMYALTKRMLKDHGYERYEISNYAKRGFESKHNSSYWIGTDYIGFGLGAASLFENSRYSNCQEIVNYIEKPEKASVLEEKLTKEALISEFMILGLRRCEGVSEKDFIDRFHEELMVRFGKEINQCIADGLLVREGGRVFLTDYGLDVSNYVFKKFI